MPLPPTARRRAAGTLKLKFSGVENQTSNSSDSRTRLPLPALLLLLQLFLPRCLLALRLVIRSILTGGEAKRHKGGRRILGQVWVLQPPQREIPERIERKKNEGLGHESLPFLSLEVYSPCAAS